MPGEHEDDPARDRLRPAAREPARHPRRVPHPRRRPRGVAAGGDRHAAGAADRLAARPGAVGGPEARCHWPAHGAGGRGPPRRLAWRSVRGAGTNEPRERIARVPDVRGARQRGARQARSRLGVPQPGMPGVRPAAAGRRAGGARTPTRTSRCRPSESPFQFLERCGFQPSIPSPTVCTVSTRPSAWSEVGAGLACRELADRQHVSDSGPQAGVRETRAIWCTGSVQRCVVVAGDVGLIGRRSHRGARGDVMNEAERTQEGGDCRMR